MKIITLKNELGKELMKTVGGFAFLVIGEEQIIIGPQDVELIRGAIKQLD